jgi:myo-inositol-1(or 4)-monophosphatase
MSQSQPLTIDLDELTRLMSEAGEMALSYFGRAAAQWKPDNTLVSEADRAVERFLSAYLTDHYPASSILGEEFGLNEQQSDHLWVLDPIDGTAAFLAGFPVWGVSVGYMFRGRPIAGAFYLPVTNELYYGDQENAYLNKRVIPSWEPTAIHSETTLLTPSNAHRKYKIRFPGKIRNFGSAGAHLCYVTAGKAIGTLLDKVNLWDIAGVLPLLRSRGCDLYKLNGEPLEVSQLLNDPRIPEPLVAAPTWYKAELLPGISR